MFCRALGFDCGEKGEVKLKGIITGGTQDDSRNVSMGDVFSGIFWTAVG
jgi:hypothetical protein